MNLPIWIWLVYSSAWLGCGMLLSYAYASRPARAHRALFLGIIAAVATPVLAVTVGSLGWGLLKADASEPIAAWLQAGAAEYPANQKQSGPVARGETGGIPLATALACVWLVLSLFALIRFLVGAYRAAALLSRARPLLNAVLHEQVETIARSLGVTRIPTVYTSPETNTPALWGWRLHPVVLLPDDSELQQLNPEMEAVLCHEMAHYRRRDPLVNLAADLAACLLIWNPLMWWARRRLWNLSEYACDDWVLARGYEADQYAETLVSWASGRPLAAMPAASGPGKAGIARRVERLMHAIPKPPVPGRSWSVMLALFVSGGVAGAALLQPGGPSSFSNANLVVNGSFESGGVDPAGWTRGADLAGVEYVWQRDFGRTGGACIGFNKTADNYFPIAQWRQGIAGVPSRFVEVGAWVRAKGAYKAVIDVQFLAADGEWRHEWAAYIGARELDDPPANHGWRYYQGVAAVPEGAQEVSVALQMYGPGEVWFDDVSARFVGAIE